MTQNGSARSTNPTRTLEHGAEALKGQLPMPNIQLKSIQFVTPPILLKRNYLALVSRNGVG